jgi:hypothetical protein
VEERVKVAEEATKLGSDESDALSETTELGGKKDHVTKNKFLRGSVSKRKKKQSNKKLECQQQKWRIPYS